MAHDRHLRDILEEKILVRYALLFFLISTGSISVPVAFEIAVTTFMPDRADHTLGRIPDQNTVKVLGTVRRTDRAGCHLEIGAPGTIYRKPLQEDHIGIPWRF